MQVDVRIFSPVCFPCKKSPPHAMCCPSILLPCLPCRQVSRVENLQCNSARIKDNFKGNCIMGSFKESSHGRPLGLSRGPSFLRKRRRIPSARRSGSGIRGFK
eukprot:4512000-Pyramimonas_sp.AAC.1